MLVYLSVVSRALCTFFLSVKNNMESYSQRLSSRVNKFRSIARYGDLRTEACLNQIAKQVTNNIFVHKRIGSSSVNGEAYLAKIFACENRNCEPDDLAVKLIPIKGDELRYIRDHRTNRKAYTTGLWAELLVMEICTILIHQEKIPNLPMAFSYMLCNNCQYENPALSLSIPRGTPCLILLNELADGGDIATWMKTSHDALEWSTAYFQIFASLYFLQKFFNLTHHDLHWGNVLVHKVTETGYSAYDIDGKTYYVPNAGYEFVLWDFGYCRIPGKIEIAALADYYNLPEQQPRLLVDYMRIALAPTWIRDPKVIADSPEYGSVDIPNEISDIFLPRITQLFSKGYTLKRVIPEIWHEFTKIPEDDLITGRYDFDNPLVDFPKKYAFLLHDYIRDPIPERVPMDKQLAQHNVDIYYHYGQTMMMSVDGELAVEDSPRDYEDYDPMDTDED